MKVDHIGYAVNNLDKSMECFKILGYQFGQVFNDTDRNVRIVFGMLGTCKIELVAPMDNTVKTPVKDILFKMGGPTPYHICYATDDIEKGIEMLTGNRFRLMIPPAEAIAFNKRKVAFLYNLQVGLIEIVEE